MKTYFYILAASIWLSAGTLAFARVDKTIDVKSELQQLHFDVKHLGQDVEILRRDQINYKIEKDLLKETYGSNIQTINLVITIVLGVLGVLGYLGIRSVKEIRSDYASDLEKLRTMKAQLESEIELLRAKQKEVESQVGDLAKTNEDQDRRLKLMELIEKISSLIQSQQWGWALKYADIGLGLDSENTLLLSQKSTCHAKQGELTAAIDALRRVLALEPENWPQAMNLLEFFALSNQHEEFDLLYSKYRKVVDEDRNGALVIYLKSLLLITGGELEAGRMMLREFFSAHGAEPRNYLGAWSFDEARTITSKIPVGEQRTLVDAMIALFEGKKPPTEFLNVLNFDGVEK